MKISVTEAHDIQQKRDARSWVDERGVRHYPLPDIREREALDKEEKRFFLIKGIN